MVKSTATRLESGQSSQTAEINAQMRSADAKTGGSRRLVGDPFARHFVTNPRYKLLALTPGIALGGLRLFDRLFGGLLAEILLRDRYFEEALHDAWRAGVRTTVLLGAGYDTTALRHPEMREMRFFEIDHPATQRTKLRAIEGVGIQPGNITYLPIDLSCDDFVDELPRHGFETSAPCLVCWLGVSYYLSAESFQDTLVSIARVSAPGSRLVFDYLDESVVNGTTTYRGARRAARSVMRRGEPYTLGFTSETVADSAEKAGFRVVESIRVPDLVRRYGGDNPYCRDDDYMGVLTVERVADGPTG